MKEEFRGRTRILKVLERNLKFFKFCVHLPIKIAIQTQRMTIHSIVFFYKTMTSLYSFCKNFVLFSSQINFDQLPERSLSFFEFLGQKYCEQAQSIIKLLKFYFDFSLIQDKKKTMHNFIFVLKKDVSLEVDIKRISFTKLYENILKIFETYKQRMKEAGRSCNLRNRKRPIGGNWPPEVRDQSVD